MAEAVPPDEIAQLRAENERLKQDNSKLLRRAAWRARIRRAAITLLLVLGCGLVGASVIAIWTRATILNTDRYVNTMAPIARSPAVQSAVADKLSTAIISKVDVQALAREALPDRADVLAPAIAEGVNGAVRRQINDFVHSDRFPELWDNANRRVHETVVGLLTTGKAGRLALQGDTVYLDLSAAVDRVKDRLRQRGFTRIADAIPPTVDGRIELLSSDGFSKGRDAIHRLERLSIVLPILAILFLAAHVFFSESKRRGLLRVGIGLALTGLLLLALVGIGRTLYLNAIDQAVLPRQAAADIFDKLIVVLREALRITVLAAVVLAVLSLLAGRPMRVAIEKGGPAAARDRVARRHVPADDLAGRPPGRRAMGRRTVRRARARRLGQPDGRRRPDRRHPHRDRGDARRRARPQWTPTSQLSRRASASAIASSRRSSIAPTSRARSRAASRSSMRRPPRLAAAPSCGTCSGWPSAGSRSTSWRRASSRRSGPGARSRRSHPPGWR